MLTTDCYFRSPTIIMVYVFNPVNLSLALGFKCTHCNFHVSMNNKSVHSKNALMLKMNTHRARSRVVGWITLNPFEQCVCVNFSFLKEYILHTYLLLRYVPSFIDSL